MHPRAHATLVVLALLVYRPATAAPPGPATFSIVAADPMTGEVGVAVASRFFGVGIVVPYGSAGVGMVATQAHANTSYGPSAIALLERGLTPDEVVEVVTRQDEGRETRQLGVVTAAGASATYTGTKCLVWAGGRRGPGYAIQGNILAGEAVVDAMEKSFLATQGQPLAERLYAALKAGDKAGGDSRGKQSAALVVLRAHGGFGGYTDRAIDVRVDDHAEPIEELGRLLTIGVTFDLWNQAWKHFVEKRFAEALTWQERTAAKARGLPSMEGDVMYDLAVIRLAAGDKDGAWRALQRAVALEPRLAAQAEADPDLAALRPFPGPLGRPRGQRDKP